MDFETVIAGVVVTVTVDREGYAVESDPPVSAGWLRENAEAIEFAVAQASCSARERHDDAMAERRGRS